MTLADILLPEFEQEMATTRRLLERVPDGQGEWRPHPKAFPFGHLAQLVAWLPGWVTNTLRNTELDLASHAGYTFEPTAKLVAMFDDNVREAREAIRATPDSAYDVMWSLKRGDQTLLTLPRRVLVRQHISHLIHHRGQLSVYLRMRDVPVPSIYGPSGDERVSF